MSNLPGFQKVGGGVTKFSELEMDKTFDESMKLLNNNSTVYDWYFTQLHNEWDFTISNQNYHSTFDFHADPVSDSDMPIHHHIQLSRQNKTMNTKSISSFGDLVAFEGGTLVGNYLYNELGEITFRNFQISAGNEFFSKNNDQTYESALQSTRGQINGKEILVRDKRYISLIPNEGVYEHSIHGDTKAIYYFNDNYTVQFVNVEGNLSEYILGKDVIFQVIFGEGDIRNCTLTEINGTTLIRDIPSTVTTFYDYNPQLQDYLLDLSHLTIESIDESCFVSGKGTLLINTATYEYLFSENRLEPSEEYPSEYIYTLNPEILVRVVA